MFDQLVLALKTKFALIFFKPGGRPTPRLVHHWPKHVRRDERFLSLAQIDEL